MVPTQGKWKRRFMLSLPAFLLACCLVFSTAVLAQQNAPTQKLFQAVQVNDMNAVKSAIAAGADLGAKNGEGKTAADVAVDKGHFIIAHFLLSERSAKNTAKRLSKTAATAPEDRLRKPNVQADIEKPARPSVRRPARETELPAAVPARPDTATRVIKALEPSNRRPPSEKPVQLVKQSKFGMPPVKPDMPSQMPAPMTEEVSVAPPPGRQQPDGRDPVGEPSETLPSVIAEDDSLQELPSTTSEIADAGAEKPVPETAEPEKSASSLDPVGAVSNFFQSLVDLVSPTSEETPSRETPRAVSSSRKKPASSTEVVDTTDKLDMQDVTDMGAPDAEQPLGNDLMAEPVLESIDRGLVSSATTNEDDGALTRDLVGLADTEESLPGLAELENDTETDVLPAPAKSASARTLERIKSLLGDKPEEDEFGLPEVVISSREKSDNDASDTVLDRLADSGAPSQGFLDDRAGPETGPGRQPISDSGSVQAPVSDALRARLRRLGDAVSRDVKIDTDEILRSGRSRQNEIQLESRARRPVQRRRTDRLVDGLLSPDNEIQPRTTPADRLATRFGKMEQLDQQRENAYGIPIGGQRRPLDAVETTENASGMAATATGQGNQVPVPEAQQEVPSVLDRMVGFFGGAQTQPSAPKMEEPNPQAPDYRGSPSTRRLDEELPAPEIDNLQAFDQVDETRPAQQPGTLEPVFLNRLAGLFSEEEKTQSAGWKAEVVTEHPFPAQGRPADRVADNPWTTKVEVNVGEGKEPVVLEVAQAPAAAPTGLEDSELQPPRFEDRPKTTGGKPTAMAKEAYRDPLRAPEETKAEAKKKTFIGRLTKLFQPKDPVELERESLLLEQDERLSTAHDASGGGVEVASRTKDDPKTYWPIVKLTKSDPQPAPPRPSSALTRTSLDDVTLTLGESVNLVNIFPPGKDGSDPNNQCVKKNRGTTLFCIEPIDWSDDIRSSFMIATILYTGPMAVVRYDQAAATRLHALFNSEDFDSIAAYYEKRYGEPTEILKRSIAPLAQPRQDNPTISWRSLDQLNNAITVLEIRKFDDTRGGFPDTTRGAVMLYYSTAPSIFPQVSAHELMRLKRIVDITQSEQEKEASAAAAGPASAISVPASAGVSPDELFGSEPINPSPSLPTVSDTTLETLMGDQNLERPEDILNEPVLMAPDIQTDDSQLPSGLTNDLPGDLPRGLTNDLPNDFPGVLPDNLLGEPITDEPPDQLIEILPNNLGNPS